MKFFPRAISFCVLLIALTSFAGQAQSIKETKYGYQVHKVNDNVYILAKNWGAWINFGVVIGDDGVMLISSMMQQNAEKLEAQIKALTDKPVKYVLNVAADNFHHSANRYFAERGATILSHQQLKYHSAFTQVTFDDQISVPMGEETVTAYYTPAHDLGQLVVHLEDSNVIFMGDAYRNDWLMFTGQNGIAGQAHGLDLAIQLADDDTLIVPGNRHSVVFNNKDDVQQAKDTMFNFASTVGKLQHQGLSVDQIGKHPEIQSIIKPLESYESSIKYLADWISEVIDTEYASAFTLTPAQLQHYVGTYSLTPDSQIEVFEQGGNLYAREVGKFNIKLTPLSASHFDFSGWTENDILQFSFADDGVVTGLTPVISEGSWNQRYFAPGNRVKL